MSSLLSACVSLELLMTRQAVTAAMRKPQENSTWLIKQNGSFQYCWSPQTGGVWQSWAVLRTADSTKLAQHKAHSDSEADNLLPCFQITLNYLTLLLHPEGPGVTPDCYHDRQVIPGLVGGGIRQSNTGCSRFLYRCCRHLSMGGHGGCRSQSLKLCLQHQRIKERGPLEIHTWNESLSFYPVSNSGQHQVS